MKFKSFIFSLFVFILFPFYALSQTQSSSTISGGISDLKTKQALEFVNVSLFHVTDSTIVSGAVSDKNGEYIFKHVTAGKYFIKLSFMGFEPVLINNITVQNNIAINLGISALRVSNVLLDDVSVVKTQSTLNTSIDRKTYNVAKDIMGQSGSASQILENIPSVTVDVDGTVSLRGSTNLTFFVNGRPSSLLKHNSAVALQQIPANTIERIEVITNPSAKYKPDGIGGIINLVLKKEKQEGFNGMLMANVGNQGRNNANLTMNYNTGKMNLFGSYGFRRNNSPRTSYDYRINRDSMLNVINSSESNSSAEARPISHLGNFGLDYQFNENNKLELAGNINFQDMHRTQNTLSTWKDKDSKITSEYNTLTINDEPEMEWETSAVFSHQFEKEGHELQFEFNLTGYNETEDNRYNETYSVPPGSVDLSHMLIKKGGPQAEFYAEYVLPLGEETELEAGYVGEYFKDNVSYFGESYDHNNNKWVTDLNKSNDFVFHQTIHAFYSTLSHSFEKLSFMAGLRAEQALITSNLTTLDSVVPNNYFRVYPTLHLAFDLNDDQQFQINYSHRVRRPDSDEMNPFPEYSDPRNMEAGNPHLKPEQIHSIEFGYQLKKESFSIQPTVYYRYTYDAFAEIYKYVNDSVLLRSAENLAKDQSMGMEFIATYNAGKFITLNLSTNGYYHIIDASNLGYSANKSAFALNTKLGANFNITSSTLFQFYAYHRSARLTAQGRYNPVFYANMGLRQELFKNKASLILTVSDVFNTLKSESINDTPLLYRKSVRGRISQIMYLGFTYRFGNSSKNKTEDLRFDNSI